MHEQASGVEMLYDPFTGEFYDSIATFDAYLERYQNGKVEHDYSADEFLRDTQSIMMDAHFLGRMRDVQDIATRMHLLCNHDEQLSAAMLKNESASTYLSSHVHRPDENTQAQHDDVHNKKNSKSSRNGRKVAPPKPQGMDIFINAIVKKDKEVSGWLFGPAKIGQIALKF